MVKNFELPTWNLIPVKADRGTTGPGSIGDVNGDGVIDAVDLTYLRRHLAGRPDYVRNDAMDVNNDGYVDEEDLKFLRRHLVGRSGYELQ
jgi:hypothetical protein